MKSPCARDSQERKLAPGKIRNAGRRIAFYVLLALVPLLVAAGFYLTGSAQRQIKQAYYAHAKAVSAFVARGLKQEREKLNHYLDFWVSNPSFELAFESASAYGDTTSIDQRAAQVLAKLNLDSLEVVDISGEVLASLHKNRSPGSHQSEFLAHFQSVLQKGQNFSGIVTIDNGLWIVSTAPVQLNQMVVGGVAFSSHIDSNYLAPIRELARADIVILRGSEVVASSPPDLAQQPFFATKQQIPRADGDQYVLIENGENSYLAIYSPLDDVDGGNTPITILVLLDAAEYRTALVHAAQSWFVAIGILSFVVILVAFYVGRTIDRINQTVVEARDYTESIIKAMTHTLLVVKPDHIIQSANGAALKLLGYREDELVGQPIQRILLAGPSLLKEASRKGVLRDVDVVYCNRDGGPISMSFSASTLKDSHGAVSGIVCIAEDISQRKEAEARLENVNRELLQTSRQAGMAEVAASVLHNVGNVLNSVNISGSVIADKIAGSKAVNLGKAVALLQRHAGDLPHFLTEDPKGKLLPSYLADLSERLTTERQDLHRELELLLGNIKHIKEIVAMQQSYARMSGMSEECDAVELLENAIQMNEHSLANHQINLVREYADIPHIMVEKHKVLQILVNLLRNAKYACDDSNRPDKEIVLRVVNGDGRIKISVTDNGIGIPPENLTHIFAHGFTTRKDGHGFGLHSGALAAKEMGGELIVSSAGPGKGATFTLDLPVEPEGTIYEG